MLLQFHYRTGPCYAKMQQCQIPNIYEDEHHFSKVCITIGRSWIKTLPGTNSE